MGSNKLWIPARTRILQKGCRINLVLTALKLLVKLVRITAGQGLPHVDSHARGQERMAMGLPAKAKRRALDAARSSSIALIDDRPLMRHCFGRWLEESTRDARIVTVASPTDVLDNAQLARETHLIVLSIGSARVAEPGVLDSIHALARCLPEVPIVLLSDRDDVEEVAKAIRHGVRGYVPTKLELSELTAAIHCVEAGGTFVPADTLIRFVLHQRTPTHPGSEVERTLW